MTDTIELYKMTYVTQEILRLIHRRSSLPIIELFREKNVIS